MFSNALRAAGCTLGCTILRPQANFGDCDEVVHINSPPNRRRGFVLAPRLRGEGSGVRGGGAGALLGIIRLKSTPLTPTPLPVRTGRGAIRLAFARSPKRRLQGRDKPLHRQTAARYSQAHLVLRHAARRGLERRDHYAPRHRSQ
jgi:hypothetical protein